MIRAAAFRVRSACRASPQLNRNFSYLAAIDEGTSSTRFVIADKHGKIVASKQKELTQHHPHAGHSEHDATEIWDLTKKCIEQCMAEANLTAKDIASVGITNQRETTVVWNKVTGKPYHHAIVWNDNRTSAICKRLMSNSSSPFWKGEEHGLNMYKDITGLPLAPYFSATKLMYLLETVPGLRKDAEDGVALFGTIDSWLIYNLTGGKSHVTDVSNASRTLLMDLKSCSWSPELLQEFNIPAAMLPKIVPSAGDAGTISGVPALKDVMVGGILGDQQAALFGQTCFNYKDIKVTYGTGAFLLMNTGTDIVQSTHGLLTTVAYQLGPDEPPTYALEGSVAYAGATMQWCRDSLGLMVNTATEAEVAARRTAVIDIDDHAAMESELEEEPEEEVYFVPAFSGLFAPYWRSDARGLIAGFTAHHTKDHFIRAALESAAYSVMDVIRAMHKDISFSTPSTTTHPTLQQEASAHADSSDVKVDGGMTLNKYLMQFQSNLLNANVRVPEDSSNMTAMGALYAAGIGCGMFSRQPDGVGGKKGFREELGGLWRVKQEFNPHISESRRQAKIVNWHKAIERSSGWNSSK
jgi:glycerol kinase